MLLTVMPLKEPRSFQLTVPSRLEEITAVHALVDEALKAYDPALYALFERVYPGHHIPADVYYAKNLSPRRPTSR